MTLAEAAKLGISRLYKATWSNPDDRIELHLDNGFYGPWAVLYSPSMRKPELAKQTVLMLGDTADDWLPYTGPLE